MVLRRIQWSTAAEKELLELPAADRRRVSTMLAHDANVVTKRRKFIQGEELRWRGGEVADTWQLTVVPYRIFYDVENGLVIVQAIAKKPPNKRTKDIVR
jgi:mRNA-degrading endonuclease RelE of RelBE toxin-antitoxin system